jgi:hypothetical protein
MHFQTLTWTSQPPELHAATIGDELFPPAPADLAALSRAERRLLLEQLALLLSLWGEDPLSSRTWTLSSNHSHNLSLSSNNHLPTPWAHLPSTLQHRLHLLTQDLLQDLHPLLLL